MEKLSVRKFSILGVALVSASAIVAAVLPSKAKATFIANGIVRSGSAFDSNPNQLTCVPAASAQNCNDTVSAVNGQSKDTAKGASVSNATTLNDI